MQFCSMCACAGVWSDVHVINTDFLKTLYVFLHLTSCTFGGVGWGEGVCVCAVVCIFQHSVHVTLLVTSVGHPTCHCFNFVLKTFATKNPPGPTFLSCKY